MAVSLDKIGQLFKRWAKDYHNDPLGFDKEVFKGKNSDQQNQVLQALKDGYTKITIRSGHGIGKTALLCKIKYWFLTTRPHCEIICTANTDDQLQDVLWRESAIWKRKNGAIDAMFEWTKQKVFYKGYPEDWFAVARSVQKGESLQGRHDENLMIMVDEASGVKDEIFEVAKGMMTKKNVIVILTGNPVHNSGYFYRTHNNEKLKKYWKTFQFSSEHSPFADKEYIQMIEDEYGKNSNQYRIRVLGDFPFDEEDTLIPQSWIEDAVERELKVEDCEPRIMGVDVGAGGDRSVMVIRKGGMIEDIIVKNEVDTMKLVGHVSKVATDQKVDVICIDNIGIGKGAFDRLSERGFEIIPVDFRRTSDVEGFKRVRDALAWRVRTQFEMGNISIPNDEDLKIEAWSIKMTPDSGDSMKLEGKKNIRKRLGRSCDKFDALVISYGVEDREFIKRDEDDEDEYEYRKQYRRNPVTGY